VLFLYLGAKSEDTPTEPEPFVLRVFVLILMAACCYGLQVLFEQRRRAEEEAREFAARQEGLHSAGRLAAQIAHQIKNPLGIINNVAYSLQKALLQGKAMAPEQVQIIRDEVERSDQILTKLMGYAQLAEGKVERLKINEELDRALAEVFPPGAAFDVTIHADYAPQLPVLMMQRGHLSEILVNLLQNAREAIAAKGEATHISGLLGLGVTHEVTDGKGEIGVLTLAGPDQAIVVKIKDNGPGIPKPQIAKVFEPYFTTKQKGTGLGLSIVRHNVEMYGGTVSIDSELGKGTTFIIELPTRTFMKLQK
jgi:two-component system CheB/CheR fusion protein